MITTQGLFEHDLGTLLAAPDDFTLLHGNLLQVEVGAVQVEPSLAAVAADEGARAPHVVFTHSARLVPGITH